jgi:uncharacterized protein YpuA (DUF1002 family)
VKDKTQTNQEVDKKFYGYMRKKGGKKKISALYCKESGKMISLDKDKANLLNSVNRRVFINNMDKVTDMEDKQKEHEEEEKQNIKEFKINCEQIIKTIHEMKAHKAGGADDINIDYIKLVSKEIIPYLEVIFKLSI